MHVKINGNLVEVADITNIAEIVKKRALSTEAIIVEHNYNILAREDWDKTALKEDDNIEIVSFMGGGR